MDLSLLASRYIACIRYKTDTNKKKLFLPVNIMYVPEALYPDVYSFLFCWFHPRTVLREDWAYRH